MLLHNPRPRCTHGGFEPGGRVSLDFAQSTGYISPSLFSNVPAFVPAETMVEMTRVVDAVEAAARLPSYREAVLSWAPPIASLDLGPIGALMGYDFHVTAQRAEADRGQHQRWRCIPQCRPGSGTTSLLRRSCMCRSKFHLRETSDRRSSTCSSTNGGVNEDPDVRR